MHALYIHGRWHHGHMPPLLPRAPLTVAAAVLALSACANEPEAGKAPEPSPRPTASPTAGTSADTISPTQPTAEEQQRRDTRLIEAAWANDVGRARRLIRAGADVNHQDDTQQSAFLISTSEGYLDLLELTLRHGARIDDKDSFDGTGLIRAAERGHAAVVGRLIRAGIEHDHVNNLGWTALHEAVVLGDGDARALETVRVLVAGGVDINVPSGRTGQTPREHALDLGYGAIERTLAVAEQSLARPDRALLEAAAGGDADMVARALRAGADPEARDEARRTPLLLAVTDNRLEAARTLVHLGADPDALDDRHDTPWLVTGVTGSVPMAELLLTARPDLTIRNRFGGVSIIPASERGHVAYVRRVARTGIDLDHVNNLGWTALLEAVILGEGTRPWQDIVRILLGHDADPAIADADGVTALQHARDRGFDEIARMLARRG